MQITHFSNAFNSVKINKTVIACDPWVGATNQTSWISYPVHKNGANILKNLKPNYIYISHLHCDHLDPKVLSKYKNKNIKVIIKKFSDQVLKRQISTLGYNNIMECKPWKKYKLNKDISIAIIPQMSSNVSGLSEQINYDMDTSIVIQSNLSKEVFFNGVDNPLTVNNYKKVKNFITKYFNKKIAAAVVQVGAASEYPQCFLNIDRNKEKEKVIKESLSNLKLKLRILQPEAYFSPSGGAILSGKYSILNKYVAVPSYNRIIEFLKNETYIVVDIAGGGKINRKKKKWILIKSKISKDELRKKKIVKKYSNKKYFYSNDYKRIDQKDIDQAFFKSYENYKKRLTNFQINTNWDTEFCIYKNIFINLQGKINLKNSKFIKKYTLRYNESNHKLLKNNYSKLKCHLDFNLFYGLLKRKYTNWNQPISGSVILYERKPNKFDPNVTLSLNYLTA